MKVSKKNLGLKLNRLGLYWRTLRHLKWTQFRFRLWYFIKGKLKLEKQFVGPIPSARRLTFQKTAGVPPGVTFQGNTFTALNIRHSFADSVDWNYAQYGKLWTYNLNYFEYLHNPNSTVEEKLGLMHEFKSAYADLKDALEPYPTSLRIINWIRFIEENQIEDSSLNEVIYRDVHRLTGRLEYHILANHLLENSFALLMGGIYFDNQKWIKRASKLLTKELKEQVMTDGMHYERSAMYHCIIYYRVLEALDLTSNSPDFNELRGYLVEIAIGMQSWLTYFTQDSLPIPYFNDAAPGIAQSPDFLSDYANLLGISAKPDYNPSDSGYRLFRNSTFNIRANVGSVSPSYQPGHAHADTLSFELFLNGNPVIVDTGTSTYQVDNRRAIERSTFSHNTIVINNSDSSEVWGGFRVGRRAVVKRYTDSATNLLAEHDGFKRFGVKHAREWIVDESSKSVTISDKLFGKNKSLQALSSVHFHPDVHFELMDNRIVLDNCTIELIGYENISVENYHFSDGFNRLVGARKITGAVDDFSKLIISYEVR